MKAVCFLQLANGMTEIGSVYDIASQTFTPFHFSTNAFCAGHVVAEDGTAIIAGKVKYSNTWTYIAIALAIHR